MNHFVNILKEIISNPDEDTPRLAYAEALQDRGDGLDHDRAELITIQLQLARWDTVKLSVDGAYELTRDPELTKLMAQSPFLMWSLNDNKNPNSRYGLPTMFGGAIRIVVDEKATESDCVSFKELEARYRDPEFKELRRREWEVRQRLTWNDILGGYELAALKAGDYDETYQLRRGFIESCRMSHQQWEYQANVLHWHPSIKRECHELVHPIREMVLTSVPQVTIGGYDDPLNKLQVIRGEVTVGGKTVAAEWRITNRELHISSEGHALPLIDMANERVRHQLRPEVAYPKVYPGIEFSVDLQPAEEPNPGNADGDQQPGNPSEHLSYP